MTKYVRCPRCRPPQRVTRLDGSKITGFSPEATYVGFLVSPSRNYPHFPRPPATCPTCGTSLREA